MFRMALCVTCAAVTLLLRDADASDSPQIDRTLRKEPQYAQAPRYFVLLFGPEAKTRVWCVLDGDSVLYVDRNHNGDLTNEGERFTPDQQEHAFLVGDIHEIDDKTVHRSLRVSPPSPIRGRTPEVMVQTRVKGEYVAYSSIHMDEASARPLTAPFRHFHGPLTVGFRPEHTRFVCGQGSQLLTVFIGTHYPECKEWVYVQHDDVPANIYPMAEIMFPGKAPDAASVVERMPLVGRC